MLSEIGFYLFSGYLDNPENSIKQCQELLEEPNVGVALRIGDLYAMIVTHYTLHEDYHKVRDERERYRERQRESVCDRKRETETDRERQRQTETETERERQRERQREREIQRDRDTKKERERETETEEANRETER